MFFATAVMTARCMGSSWVGWNVWAAALEVLSSMQRSAIAANELSLLAITGVGMLLAGQAFSVVVSTVKLPLNQFSF